LNLLAPQPGLEPGTYGLTAYPVFNKAMFFNDLNSATSAVQQNV